MLAKIPTLLQTLQLISVKVQSLEGLTMSKKINTRLRLYNLISFNNLSALCQL